MKLYNIKNNSNSNLEHVFQLIQHFFPYAQQQLGFHKPVMVSFQSDEENANKLLGRTGYYNPDDFSIAIYVDGRHPKDMLRSLSHELVHHAQNCNGEFDSAEELSPGYAQENPAMRNAELDAYKRGNIIFRDFEDLIKKGKIKVNIDFAGLGEPKMSLKEWKNDELNTLLMKKWGLLKEGGPGKCAPGQTWQAEIEHEEETGRGECVDLNEAELEEGTPAYRDDDDMRSAVEPRHIRRDDPDTYIGPALRTPAGTNPDLARAYGVGPPAGAKPDPERDRMEFPAWKDKDSPPPGTNVAGTKWQKAKTHKRLRPVSVRETKETLTLDEARDLARRIFERISKEIN